ncbi:MAG: 8-amino-7-oxononanoate synthase [Deltaproteobacteria bacterium]|nr:8-amino-7-oxononanoate synthase [Deltaproteobacteria bacterium]
MDKFYFIKKEIQARKQNHRFRSLRTFHPLKNLIVKTGQRKLINFCSNDYLGLSANPELRKNAFKFMKLYGNGSTSSRLVCGCNPAFEAVEYKLSRLKGSESSLIFNSGFQANMTVIPALLDKRSVIFSDELNHNSLIQGALLSRCEINVFKHNDLRDLEYRLQESEKKNYTRRLILSESVFSMDGDQSDLEGLIALSERYGAILMIDEAHATGVLGEKGMGLCDAKRVDLIMGTFGKAMGSFGAYLSCAKELADYFVNHCSGFIYTTALPPSTLGAIDAALSIVPGMDFQRETLLKMSAYLRDELNKMGYDTGYSTTQIIPVIIGNDQEVLDLGQWLEDQGFLAIAIRPPTVKAGQARIRLTLSAKHNFKQIDALLKAFTQWRNH